MNVGIEQIAFATPEQYIDMADLAKARGIDPKKYLEGIGQDLMGVPKLADDIVSLGANAAQDILLPEDKEAIRLVILATESGVDQSKAAAVYVHHLLGLSPQARSVEMKEACYSGTAALHLAATHVLAHPREKALVIASDIARYGLNTAGEPTQGAGAVAMLVSADPKILRLNLDSSVRTEDCMDFWRPNYQKEALVNGKLSLTQYLHMLQETWEGYKTATQLTVDDFAAICLHIPYTKMGLKGLRRLRQEGTEETSRRLEAAFQTSTYYNRQVGNIYTASLYLSLLSLLEQNESLQGGERLGFFSYGSGSVAEFFSGTLSPGYEKHLHRAHHESLLKEREQWSIAAYEANFKENLPINGQTREVALPRADRFQLLKVADHKRYYG